MPRVAPALALLLLAGPALGQAPEPSPYAPKPPLAGPISSSAAATYGPAHQGLYLSMTLGGAGLRTRGSYPGGDQLSARGGGVQFGFGLGGSLAPGVILAGHLFGVTASNADFNMNGVSLDARQLSFVGMGPSLVFYAMPSNVFLQITPALTRATVDLGSGVTGGSDRGAGIYLATGAEWPVGPRWGLGLMAFAAFSSNKDADGTLKTSAFGAALSLTNN